MNKTIYLDRLKSICKENGFACRGTAFFRVIGDGVLQVIKCQKERYATNYSTSLGLFSLYGQIEREWVTSFGCIPRYSIYYAYSSFSEYVHTLSPGPPEDRQLAILQEKCIPWLTTITTQTALAEALCILDCVTSGDLTLDSLPEYKDGIRSTDYASCILWNDLLKLTPYVKSGQQEKALQIVSAIRSQHRSAREDWKKRLSEQDYVKHISKQDRINRPIYDLFELVERQNQEAIHEYMENNYRTNCSLLRFAMRTNKESK